LGSAEKATVRGKQKEKDIEGSGVVVFGFKVALEVTVSTTP